jgi:hypothetical protein
MPQKHHDVEVWAQLRLSVDDELRICDFFTTEWGIKRRCVARHMHLTVYHCRRPMPGLQQVSEPAEVLLPVPQTRFMVLAPGGENPRPDLEPARRKVGIRLQKQNPAREQIMRYRERLLLYETAGVLGTRKPSTRTRSALGAREFQPHMTLLLPRSGIIRDLTSIGRAFRESIGQLLFDRFEICLAPGPGDSSWGQP